jgi:hypothetical protein
MIPTVPDAATEAGSGWQGDNDYGDNYLQAEAIIPKLVQHYNEERPPATLGYLTPVTCCTR